MKARSIQCYTKSRAGTVGLTLCILFEAGALSLLAAQKPPHSGTKLEGFTTVVTPSSITLFDKKGRELKVLTDKDYTSLIGMGAAVTVWYTSEGGVYRLTNIEYPQSETFVPTNALRTHIRRIIILPRPEGVENSEGLISAISKYLADDAGWYVSPSDLAVEIASRSRVSTSSLDAVDPHTGAVDRQRYLASQRALAMETAKDTRSDAVLEIAVLKVKAKVRASIATWDDMSEPIASRATRTFSPFAVLGTKGWVYAVTADMNLWGQSGELLWKKRRGFAVLGVRSGMDPKYRARPLTEVYQDRDAMQRWLEGTFGQFASPGRTIPVGAPQISPERQIQLEKAKGAGEEQK